MFLEDLLMASSKANQIEECLRKMQEESIDSLSMPFSIFTQNASLTEI